MSALRRPSMLHSLFGVFVDCRIDILQIKFHGAAAGDLPVS
jgi:hypothetical protein